MARTWITRSGPRTGSPVIEALDAAVAAALADDAADGLAPVLALNGMSGRRYRRLVNALVQAIPEPRYLEIGVWTGSSLCAAICENTVTAMAVDDWSQFNGSRAQMERNLAPFLSPRVKFTLVEADFRTVDWGRHGPFNVYFYDGPHDTQDHVDAIARVAPALEGEFVLIIDDWNWRAVREGTGAALTGAGMTVLSSLQVRTTDNDSHGEPWGQLGDWHNGYFIGVIRKPRAAGVGADVSP